MSDNCTLPPLYVHPVKSCAGIGVRSSLLVETGLDLDRAWMVVDEPGDSHAARAAAAWRWSSPRCGTSDMVLRAPGMLALHLRAGHAWKSPRACRYGTTW